MAPLSPSADPSVPPAEADPYTAQVLMLEHRYSQMAPPAFGQRQAPPLMGAGAGTPYANDRPTAAQIIDQYASHLGLDPEAVKAFARTQGGLGTTGGIGDQSSGGSYGPFQLHVHGKMPDWMAQKGPAAMQAWAWSPEGIKYAMDSMALVAKGKSGPQAAALLAGPAWGRGANPTKDMALAASYYGKDAGGVSSGGLPSSIAAPPPVGGPPAGGPPGPPASPFVPPFLSAGPAGGAIATPSPLLGAGAPPGSAQDIASQSLARTQQGEGKITTAFQALVNSLPAIPGAAPDSLSPTPALGAQGPVPAPAAGSASVPSSDGGNPSSSAWRRQATYPLASAHGKLLGVPYQGTHTEFGNWESDNALDISTPVGTPVRAPVGGVIGPQIGSLNSSDPKLGGLRVHVVGGGNEFYLQHLSKLVVHAGQRVSPGQIIGYSGSANGTPHLHIGVKYGDPRVIFGYSQAQGGPGRGAAAGTPYPNDDPSLGAAGAAGARADAPPNAPQLSAPSPVAQQQDVGGLNTILSVRFKQLQDAVRAHGGNMHMTSGARTPQSQAQLFQQAINTHGSEAAAKKAVALPGESHHDPKAGMMYGLGPGAVGADVKGDIELIHKLAPHFGLSFPIKDQPWHMELAGLKHMPKRKGAS